MHCNRRGYPKNHINGDTKNRFCAVYDDNYIAASMVIIYISVITTLSIDHSIAVWKTAINDLSSQCHIDENEKRNYIGARSIDRGRDRHGCGQKMTKLPKFKMRISSWKSACLPLVRDLLATGAK